MATRSGATSTAAIGQLQEARQSLEKHLKLPVAARIGASALSLMVACKDDDEVKRVESLKGRWNGFPVEARPPA